MKIAPIPFSYDSDIEALKAPYCGKNPKKNRALKTVESVAKERGRPLPRAVRGEDEFSNKRKMIRSNSGER